MVTRSDSSMQCATCHGPLQGEFYTLIDRPQRYCGRCIETRQRCASCGAPVGDQHWVLHDQRIQCATCHATAIYDPALARQIFHETVASLIKQFSLHLNVGVEFRLVDAPTLAEMRSPDATPVPGQLLGLYRRQGYQRVIYLLYGLPRLLFRTTIAHEYAHAWQGENCPLLRDHLLLEGFAEWIAYHHLRWIGCHKAADRLLTGMHPYRAALDYVLDLEQRLGLPGVIEHIKRAE